MHNNELVEQSINTDADSWNSLSSVPFNANGFNPVTEDESDRPDRLKEIERSVETFVGIIPEYKIGSYVMRESDKIRELLKKHTEYMAAKKISRPSVVDGFLHHQDLSELARYGFDPVHGNSKTFDKLLAIGSADIRSMKELGYKRLRDFRELKIIAGSHPEVARSLQEAGYNKLPSSWDDEGFTSDQLSRMNKVAHEVFLAN